MPSDKETYLCGLYTQIAELQLVMTQNRLSPRMAIANSKLGLREDVRIELQKETIYNLEQAYRAAHDVDIKVHAI